MEKIGPPLKSYALSEQQTKKASPLGAIKVTEALPSHVSFVVDSFVRSSAYKIYLFKGVDKAVLEAELPQLATSLLKRSTVYVVTNPEDEAQVLAYQIVEPLPVGYCIHFAYTLHAFRNMRTTESNSQSVKVGRCLLFVAVN
jgi:hypothetical protein